MIEEVINTLLYSILLPIFIKLYFIFIYMTNDKINMSKTVKISTIEEFRDL